MRIGAFLVTTIGAKGLFAGNPWSIGLAGSFADGPTAAAFADADVVIAVGTALDPYVTRRGTLLEHAKVRVITLGPAGGQVEQWKCGEVAGADDDQTFLRHELAEGGHQNAWVKRAGFRITRKGEHVLARKVDVSRSWTRSHASDPAFLYSR